MGEAIGKIYVEKYFPESSNYQKMMHDDNFSVEELSAIGFGYTKLLEESNVVSHVRIGNKGEQVHAPLVSRGTADLIIAFEPAEAARVLPYLAPAGTLVFATTAVQPVTAALSKNPYRASDVIANMERALAGTQAKLVPVDDAALTKVAGSRKVLNSLLLAKALQTGCVPIDVEDLRAAIAACVKPRFVDMNLQAINVAVGE